MKRKHIWKKAFSLSFAFHIVVIVTVGSMVAGFHQEIQRPEEQLITVNLADTPEEIAKAQESASPLSSLKEMLQPQSGSENNTVKENTAKPQKDISPESADDKAPSNQNSEPINSSGQLSSPDGILPNSGGSGTGDVLSENGGDGEADENAGEGTGGSEGYSEGGSTDGGEGTGSGSATEDRYSVASRFAQAVESNKSYPYAAVRLGQQGVVTVNVTLDADGNLVSASVVSSAGGNLDKAALNAVYASCPFPHGLNDSINMDVPVHFYLN